MNLKYVREQLKHVYWLCGGPCAGKTTMAELFNKNLGFQIMVDDVLKYRPYTDNGTYPALQCPNPNLNYDIWFNRPPEVHGQWLLDFSREIIDFMVVDLLKMSSDRPIVVDLGVEIEAILPYISKEQIVGLFTDRETIEENYLYRPDHKIILDCINTRTKDPEKTAKNVSKSVAWFSEQILNSCRRNEIFIINRDKMLTKEKQFKMVCEYFKLNI